MADRTSPVQRGKWVMEVLLGSPPPAPPPNVPALEETGGAVGGRLLSVRERMEQHRANPACMSCHKVIDPLGLALENFDVTGAWRIKDNEVPVDAVGELYDGTKMDGPIGLRRRAAEAPGRVPPELHRAPDDLRDRAAACSRSTCPPCGRSSATRAKQDYRISAFLLGVVNSPAFRMSRVEGTETTTVAMAPAHQ